MKKVEEKYITIANKEQTDYSLIENIHGITQVKLDGKDVKFEVILRLEETPKNHVNLHVFVRRNRDIFRKKRENMEVME